MPVIGLTDRDSLLGIYPVLGKLRKGSEKKLVKSKKTGEMVKIYGDDLPYFRFTSKRPDGNEIERIFQKAFGNKPDRLRVILPYATTEENFPTWREAWKGKKARILLHRCDGQNTILLRRDDGTYDKEPHPCPGGCELRGRLNVVIPELLEADLLGTVTVETGGKHDSVNITSVLYRAEESARKHGSTLEGVECVLFKSLEQVVTPEGLPVMKWLIRLAPTTEWARRLLMMAQQNIMGQIADKHPSALLSAGDDGDTHDADEDVENGVIVEPEQGPESPSDNGTNGEAIIESEAEEWAPATWEELGKWIAEQNRDPQEAKALLGEWFGKVNQNDMRAYYHALDNHYLENPLPNLDDEAAEIIHY